MKKTIVSILASVLIVLGITFSSTGAWVGLTAQVGDIINVAKWNEMIAELNTKLETNNILAGAGISVNTSGNNVTIQATGGGGVAPFLSSPPFTLAQNNSYTLNLEGTYFTPSTSLTIPGFVGSIDAISVTSPTNMDVDITIGNTTGNFDFVLANGGDVNTVWPGNGQNQLTVIIPVTGTGPAGTYTETFETGLGNWTDPGIGQAWTRDNAGTPSNGTGPTTGAGGSTWYIFTEASGANGSATFAIETTNFNIAQSVSFDYHMIGANMGSLSLQTLNNGVWTTRWSISGSQQTVQGDPYITQVVDLSLFPVEAIRFESVAGGGWSSDVALDNISIVSN